MKTLLKTLFLGLLLGCGLGGYCQSGGSFISSTPIWDGTPFPANRGPKPSDWAKRRPELQMSTNDRIGSYDPALQQDGEPHNASKVSVASHVTVQRSFTANNLNTFTPGDNTMGISDGGFIVSADNYTIDYYTDAPDTLVQFQKHHTFYGDSALNGVPFDPRVIYDRYANRFIVVMMAYAHFNDDFLLISFSRDEDPRNGWNHYRLRSDSLADGQWFDYCNVAVNRDELFISGNLLGDSAGAGITGNKVFQIRKAEGYQGAPLKFREWRNTLDTEGDMAYTMVPLPHGLQSDSYNKGIYLVSTKNLAPNDSSNKLFWYQITDSFNAPAVALNSNFTNSLVYYADPGVGLQLGSGDQIKISDSKAHSGFFLDSILTFVYCRKYLNYSVIVLNRLDLRTNTIQRFPWGNTAGQMDFTFPSVAFFGADSTDSDNLILGYMRTGSGIFPELAAVNFDDGAFWANSTIVRQGDGFIDIRGPGLEERWGDYSTIQRKYNSQPARCWFVGCYPNGANANFYGVTNGLNAFIAELGDSMILATPRPQGMQGHVTIFPNPTSGSFTALSNVESRGIVSIAVLGMQGQLLYREYFSLRNEVTIPDLGLPAGLYLVQIEFPKNEIVYEKIHVRPSR